MAKLDKIADKHDELKVTFAVPDESVLANALHDVERPSIPLGVMKCQHGGNVIANQVIATNEQIFGCDNSGSHSGGKCKNPEQDVCPIEAKYMKENPELIAFIENFCSSDES